MPGLVAPPLGRSEVRRLLICGGLLGPGARERARVWPGIRRLEKRGRGGCAPRSVGKTQQARRDERSPEEREGPCPGGSLPLFSTSHPSSETPREPIAGRFSCLWLIAPAGTVNQRAQVFEPVKGSPSKADGCQSAPVRCR